MMNTTKATRYLIIILLGIVVFTMVFKLVQNNANTELDNVTVVLTAKVLEDDVFQLFYWEKTEKEFKIENSVSTKVKGSDKFQEIKFTLPRLSEIFRFRLDIGENPVQKKVVIQKIKFNTGIGNNEFSLGEFNKLFGANKYIQTSEEGTFLGISGSNGEKSFYDPYFISIDDSKQLNLIRGKQHPAFPFLAAIIASIIAMFFLFNNRTKLVFSAKGVFIGVFMLILVLPFLQKEFEFAEELESLEKREMAQEPEFDYSKKFARSYEDYFNDNFGLRNNLVDWGGTFRTKVFRSSMHPELVMFGKDKWLFYNRMAGRVYRSYTRSSLLSVAQQDSVIDVWQKNKERYEADGRKHFLAFWPNKHSIYPENLPYAMKKQIKDTVSRVDQLIRRAKETKATIQLTDVRPVLLKNKSEELQLYYKFDSHWNDYGAFLAYQDFFNQNQGLGIKPKNTSDFDIEWKDYTWGELIQMLGVHNEGYFKEKKPVFTLKEQKNQIEYLSIDGYPKLTIKTRNEHAENKLKVLVFRDSFSNSLIQFFSLHFYEVTYIWGHHEYFVKKEKPDIIIEGFVEREIGNIKK